MLVPSVPKNESCTSVVPGGPVLNGLNGRSAVDLSRSGAHPPSALATNHTNIRLPMVLNIEYLLFNAILLDANAGRVTKKARPRARCYDVWRDSSLRRVLRSCNESAPCEGRHPRATFCSRSLNSSSGNRHVRTISAGRSHAALDLT